MFDNIPGSNAWKKVEPLTAGWSKDIKYHIYLVSGDEMLLRISNIALYDKRKAQFEALKEVAALNMLTPRPIAFGLLDDSHVYMLISWLPGESAETLIPHLEPRKQYDFGVEAGAMLQMMHQLPLQSKPNLSWYEQYCNKILIKIERMNQCALQLLDNDLLIQYLVDHQQLVQNRPLAFTHGDFHVGNMIVHQGKIGIIDFDKSGEADAYDDFKPFCWNVYASPYFASGIIDGYFNEQIPSDFFAILALYAAESLISHLPWAVTFGESEITIAFQVIIDTLKWFDHFRNIIPSWYQKP